MVAPTRTFISGLGYHHPEAIVDNDHFARRMDTSDEWIRSHTGIVERRYASDDVDTSDLGARATCAALADAGWEPSELEFLICATSTPDCLIPSTASYICNKLGLPSVAFDVNAACSGFVYGLVVAQGMMQAQGYERVALCTAEKYSRVVDPGDRRNVIFWGDGAATVTLQGARPRRGLEIVDVSLRNRNEGADMVKTPINGFFTMSGREVGRIAAAGMAESTIEILERNDLSPDDLRALVCHQANLRLIESLADRFGMSNGRHWSNVEMFGNQGAAGVITALCQGIEEQEADGLRDGDLLLVVVYGSGFTSGSALLRWLDSACD